jgi:hypothetical protein
MAKQKPDAGRARVKYVTLPIELWERLKAYAELDQVSDRIDKRARLLGIGQPKANGAVEEDTVRRYVAVDVDAV